MSNLIDKAALVAEIENRKHQNLLNEGAFEEDIDILSLLDTLEVKEVDLEKEIYIAMPSKYCWSGDGKAVYSKEQMRNFAKKFFELGLKAQKGE